VIGEVIAWEMESNGLKVTAKLDGEAVRAYTRGFGLIETEAFVGVIPLHAGSVPIPPEYRALAEERPQEPEDRPRPIPIPECGCEYATGKRCPEHPCPRTGSTVYCCGDPERCDRERPPAPDDAPALAHQYGRA
jgi:hypothetical protein